MQNTSTTSFDQLHTTLAQALPCLGRVGADPSRLLTISEWWHEMDEPVTMLSDPKATFREDEITLGDLCQRDGIAYRPASDEGRPGAFPAWRLAMFYGRL